MPILDHLEPRAVFSCFEQLCAIPHGSGNTKAISDYLVRFAAEHQLRCIQDAHNNVIIFAPGTPGYETAAPVILQGHMDMVCETAPDCTKDMAREGLDLFVDGDTIGARGTTLGGDDGIAVAMALAILAADDIPHPPLEVVITVDEETGMLGAADSVEFHYSPHPLFTLPTDNGLRHAIESPAPGIPANFPTPIKKIGDPI